MPGKTQNNSESSKRNGGKGKRLGSKPAPAAQPERVCADLGILILDAGRYGYELARLACPRNPPERGSYNHSTFPPF